MNRERKTCRAKYYESRIQHLKGENPKKWWDEVKRLSTSKVNSKDFASLICIKGFSDLSLNDQTNTINSALLESLEEYRLPLPLRRLPLETHSPEILHVTERKVQRVLVGLNPRKAYGPDRIPN